MSEAKLPVHGFVLAGGKSSRMGVDKATLLFGGRPMIEIAVEKLRSFCADVSIVGNREDLRGFAPVVLEGRMNAGPAAGVEAGLGAATQDWVVFVPVDAPLVPSELLGRWVRAVIGEGCRASFLVVGGERQPVFCALRRETRGMIAAALDRGERRLGEILASIEGPAGGRLWACDAAEFAERTGAAELERWFSNVNTPQELAENEAWLKTMGVLSRQE
jgi:molybdopterin-guanine dinucleotide biosynthesis protein A